MGQTSPHILLNHSATFGRFKDSLESGFYFKRECSTQTGSTPFIKNGSLTPRALPGGSRGSSTYQTTYLFQDFFAWNRLHLARADFVSAANCFRGPEALNLVKVLRLQTLNQLVCE